jgi:YVTN family beta-propeller protein
MKISRRDFFKCPMDDGAGAYVTNTLNNTVSVVDTTAYRVAATVPVGQAPNGISYWYITGGMP